MFSACYAIGFDSIPPQNLNSIHCNFFAAPTRLFTGLIPLQNLKLSFVHILRHFYRAYLSINIS